MSLARLIRELEESEGPDRTELEFQIMVEMLMEDVRCGGSKRRLAIAELVAMHTSGGRWQSVATRGCRTEHGRWRFPA